MHASTVAGADVRTADVGTDPVVAGQTAEPRVGAPEAIDAADAPPSHRRQAAKPTTFRRKVLANAAGISGGITPADAPNVKDEMVQALFLKAAQRVITVPLSTMVVVPFVVLVVLASLGAVYLYKLAKQPQCACKLCLGDYEIAGRLAQGGFGRVFVVTRELDGAEFVLKKVPVEDVNEANDAQAEAKELRILRHPRIVEYVDDFLHVNTSRSPGADAALFVCIVMERCERDLRQAIEDVRGTDIDSAPDTDDEADVPVVPSTLNGKGRRKKGKGKQGKSGHNNSGGHSESKAGGAEKAPNGWSTELFPEEQVRKYLVQLCTALRFTHSKSIVHRDIKPQNVFIDSHDNVRLGDFGLCRSVQGNRFVQSAYTDAGTDCYKAPETLLGGRRDARKADLWGVGLLLHELTTRTLAFERDESIGAMLLQNSTKLDKIMTMVPSSYSPRLRRLMHQMLDPNPRNRPSAEQILRLKWLRGTVKRDARQLHDQRRVARLKQANAGMRSPSVDSSMTPQRARQTRREMAMPPLTLDEPSASSESSGRDDEGDNSANERQSDSSPHRTNGERKGREGPAAASGHARHIGLVGEDSSTDDADGFHVVHNHRRTRLQRKSYGKLVRKLSGRSGGGGAARPRDVGDDEDGTVDDGGGGRGASGNGDGATDSARVHAAYPPPKRRGSVGTGDKRQSGRRHGGGRRGV